MEDINLFGEMQEYQDEDAELHKRIKELVLRNGDNLYFENLFEDLGTNEGAFDEFFETQKHHLAKIYKGCKSEKEFLGTYAYSGEK